MFSAGWLTTAPKAMVVDGSRYSSTRISVGHLVQLLDPHDAFEQCTFSTSLNGPFNVQPYHQNLRICARVTCGEFLLSAKLHAVLRSYGNDSSVCLNAACVQVSRVPRVAHITAIRFSTRDREAMVATGFATALG